MKRIAAVITAAVALGGCAVGPKYRRPQVEMPDTFRGAPQGGTTVSIADTPWKDLFPDPVVNQMVSTAIEKNFDLRIAAERAEQARLQVGITRANQFPFLDAQAGFTSTRPSTLGSSTFVRPGTNLSATFTSIGLALNWEIDLWGRLRRLTEAARARYLASEEGRHAVTVSLVGDVFDSYFQLLAQDLELQISRQTLESARESLRIVTLRRDRGAASGLDVSQAEQLVYTATASIAATEREIAQAENQLSLLQGGPPEAQARGRKLEEIPLPAEVPSGMPSALLERRPDIRQAEQNLVAANAEIGAARALYYPQISLSSFAGGQSRYLFDIASAPARVYTVAPTALQSIFRAGQTRNQVRLTEAAKRELLIGYQQTIYTAMREVSDSLVGFDKLREQRAQQEELVRTLAESVRLSDLWYRGGLDTYLQVLTAQRNLFTSQLDLARLRMLERMGVVQIYRSLGGGWQ